jgi:hypothetical protein
MKKLKLYLAHNSNDRFGVRKTELKIEKIYNIELFNPFYDSDRNDVTQLDKVGETRKELDKKMRKYTKEQCKDLVERDLDAIRHCEGILTIIKSPSFGTPMELITCAYFYRNRVYIVTKNRQALSHPWLRYMVDVSGGKMFESMTEFKRWLKKNGYEKKKKVIRE